MNSFILKKIITSEEEAAIFLNEIKKSKPEEKINKHSFNGLHREYRDFNYSKTLKTLYSKIQKAVDIEVEEYFKKHKLFYSKIHKLDAATVLMLPQNVPLELHYDSETDNSYSVDIYDTFFEKIRTKLFKKNKQLNKKNITVLMYLENYIGGELYFPEQKELIKPEPGLLVIFPAFFTHPHLVIPANDKNRYTLRFNYVIKN